jgi:hypothetical protein
VEFDPKLAARLANASLGWYTNCLTDAEFVKEIETILKESGQDDLLLPPAICADILASRPGVHPMRFQIDLRESSRDQQD